MPATENWREKQGLSLRPCLLSTFRGPAKAVRFQSSLFKSAEASPIFLLLISRGYRPHKNNQFRTAPVVLLHSSGNDRARCFRLFSQTSAQPTRNGDISELTSTKIPGQEGRHVGPEERTGICETKRRQDPRFALYGSARALAPHLLPD